jgi:hypothetical protein
VWGALFQVGNDTYLSITMQITIQKSPYHSALSDIDRLEREVAEYQLAVKYKVLCRLLSALKHSGTQSHDGCPRSD